MLDRRSGPPDRRRAPVGAAAADPAACGSGQTMAATWPDADPPRRPGSRRDCETVDHAPLEPERGIDLLRREAMPALEVLAHCIEHVVRNGFAVGALEDHEGERRLP